MPSSDNFSIPDRTLLQHLQRATLPELEAARHHKQQLVQAPQTQYVFQRTQHLMEGIEEIPQTSYTTYRVFSKTGERDSYETPYFLKRSRLAAAALRLFFGQEELKDVVQDYLWSICDESNWVVPAHEYLPIDLFASETGFVLAETLSLLGDTIDEEVIHRVREEIERRIFDPYLRFHQLYVWYDGPQVNNWSGVCNSAIAMTFLLLEPDAARTACALEIALKGLHNFVDVAFGEDGSSTEGVGYWAYGLINFIPLAEMLYACSGGAINILAAKKVKRIAAFPARLQLSASCFASFADCEECPGPGFHAGVITRFAERTGESSLFNLLARPAKPETSWRLPTLLRDILWWNGSQPDTLQLTDSWLPISGVARLVASTPQDVPVVLCIKAGNNDERHNHNDVGSFLLHVGDENLLTDPGKGLYTHSYFSSKRYENVFTNSYGHSVPRIDGLLQGTGPTFAGTLLTSEGEAEVEGGKRVAVEFARAYPCEDLKIARRELLLATAGEEAGTIWLRDHFQFEERAHKVEEAFMTWMECEVDGVTARIHGQRHDLLLTITQPQEAQFHLEYLEEASKANKKTRILKRLSFALPKAQMIDVCIQMSVLKKPE
jgi:Heparinase II/III-like protein.